MQNLVRSWTENSLAEIQTLLKTDVSYSQSLTTPWAVSPFIEIQPLHKTDGRWLQFLFYVEYDFS
jgi:hypothetical protein